MSWHETTCLDESSADQELRQELRELLGLEAGARVRTPTPVTLQTVALAEELRREALRRQHTPVTKTRSAWPMLLAAGLPVALVLGGLGAWGTVQKRRAETLAAVIQKKDAEVQRLARATAEASAQAQATQTELVRVKTGAKGGQKARELVIPAQSSPSKAPLDTQTVSNH